MNARRTHFDPPRLMLDSRRGKLGGVCAGIARHLEVAPCWVRFAAIIALCVCTQITLVAYGIAYLVLDRG